MLLFLILICPIILFSYYTVYYSKIKNKKIKIIFKLSFNSDKNLLIIFSSHFFSDHDNLFQNFKSIFVDFN